PSAITTLASYGHSRTAPPLRSRRASRQVGTQLRPRACAPRPPPPLPARALRGLRVRPSAAREGVAAGTTSRLAMRGSRAACSRCRSPLSSYPARGALLVAQAPGHARLQREQLDEARRRRLGEEAAGLREGRQAGVVDGVGRGAGDDAGSSLVKPHPDRAAHALVHALHVRVEVLAQ